MIRFIDIGTQIGPAWPGEWLREFAFFDTIVDRFITMGDGGQVWDSWEEFERSWEVTDRHARHSLMRYKGLCPEWVFQGVQLNHEASTSILPSSPVHASVPDPPHQPPDPER